MPDAGSTRRNGGYPGLGATPLRFSVSFFSLPKPTIMIACHGPVAMISLPHFNLSISWFKKLIRAAFTSFDRSCWSQ